MSRAVIAVKTLRVLQVVLVDVIVGLFSGLLVFEKTSRWPVLLVVIPLLLFVNIKQLRQMGEIQRHARKVLALVYAAGFVYGVLWTISSFEWWKLFIVPFPLAFSIYLFQRARNISQQ